MSRRYEQNAIEDFDRDLIRRWSSGIFLGPSEQSLKFPRFVFNFKSESNSESDYWIIQVFFTPIPHIRGSYGNRETKCLLSEPNERTLSTTLGESSLADMFNRKGDRMLVGTAAGIYLHQKLRFISPMRKRFESGKYMPPGSEIKDLMEVLSSVLPEGQRSSRVFEVQDKSAPISDFIEKCDARITAVLGKERLQSLLASSGLSADQWLNAGQRRFWNRLFAL
jgi:hypothetical protein